MARLVNIFEHEIIVPSWKFCNDKKEDGSKGMFTCRFVKGDIGEKTCNLFNAGLYSYGDWIKKCDKCMIIAEIKGE